MKIIFSLDKLQFFSKYLLHSIILCLRTLFLLKSLGRRAEIKTLIFLCWVMIDKPIRNRESAMSLGRFWSTLLVPEKRNTYFNEEGKSICWQRQRTCCVLSPPIPRFRALKSLKEFQISWYLEKPFAMESPIITKLHLLFSTFLFCSLNNWCQPNL